jgi:hypothetical protein
MLRKAADNLRRMEEETRIITKFGEPARTDNSVWEIRHVYVK